MRRIYAIGLLLLCLMALTGCSIIERVLTSQQSEQARTDGMFTELNTAIREGNLIAVQRLLDEGASPNIAADYGTGADAISVGNLSLAVNFNEDPVPMVKILLEAGADPSEDFPAMHDAIEKGNLEVVELLAQYGADVDSGLQSAVMFDQIAIVRMLLDHGADPNKGLPLARTTYNADMLKLLEEAGATIDNRPRYETHPEDYKTEDGVRVRIR
ncbi:ankyrin repeat domain-containing protein [Paenibacillus senegalimassiliensis]|uniref:ankyrin repeat domain-containing protein n=1 Tax=Paenibacillus senegalimassiliensis TaxID=1737426 RepID=UPI00073E5B53|nr:ankyrin repeat domain-containing protein [Paenibacillus senegalimassiliensis]